MRSAAAGTAPATQRHEFHLAERPSEYPGDLVRLGLAAGLFILTLLAIRRDDLSALERDVFRLINDLPGWLLVPVGVVQQLGTRFAPIVIGLLVIVALRRVRLGVSIMIAGTGAWLVAQGLKGLIERARPAEFLPDLSRELSSGGPGFVSGHTAVATAMAAVTAPYLSRPWRRVVWGLVVLVGFARIYHGVHLPLDVVGGFAVGWFVGTLVHMLIGTPRPLRTPEVVADMLRRLGLDVATVEPATVFAKVSHPFRVTTTDGRRLFVKVLDPDPRSTDWVLRIGRVFASGERRDISAMASLPAAADHEAAVAMAAHSAGVRVPGVVLARGDGAAAVVVLEDVPGHDLSELSADALTDAVLRDLWDQVARLHHARIAHRDLVRGNVLLDTSDQPWIVDFPDAQVGAPDRTMDGDVSELIASLAIAVGPERAVASARDALGDEAVDRALPGLEVFALSPRTRRELRDRPGFLDAVRAAAGGGPEATADLLNVHRIWQPALMSVAVYVVLLTIAGWGDVLDGLSVLRFRWVAVAGAVFAVVPVLHGLAMRLAVRRRVAVGRSAAAAAVATSAEVIGGPAARRHHLESYVRSCGGRGEEPARAVDLVLAAELLGGIVMLLGAAGAGLYRSRFELEVGATTLAFLVVAVVAGVLGYGFRIWRPPPWPPTPRWSSMVRTVRAVAAAPGSRGRALAVLASVTGAELALIVALEMSLRAAGSFEALAITAAVMAGTRVLLAVLGITGVPGVLEALLVTGLCALGIAPVPALLGVLVYATYRYWVIALVSAVAAPRLAPVHEPGSAARVTQA